MNLPTYREVYFYEDGKPIGKLFDFQISDYLYNYATEQNRKAEQKITEFKRITGESHDRSKRQFKEIINRTKSLGTCHKKKQFEQDFDNNTDQIMFSMFEKMCEKIIEIKNEVEILKSNYNLQSISK